MNRPRYVYDPALERLLVGFFIALLVVGPLLTLWPVRKEGWAFRCPITYVYGDSAHRVIVRQCATELPTAGAY